MKTTYVFIDPTTNQLIRKEGCNEYFARYSNPVISAHCVLYQAILETDDYIRTVTYKTTGCWREVLHIEHINKK
jgi:hypothetical protein